MTVIGLDSLRETALIAGPELELAPAAQPAKRGSPS